MADGTLTQYVLSLIQPRPLTPLETAKLKCIVLNGSIWVSEVKIDAVPLVSTVQDIKAQFRARGFTTIGPLYKAAKAEPLLADAILKDLDLNLDNEGCLVVYTQM